MNGLFLEINPMLLIEGKNAQLNDTRRAIRTVDRYLDELDGASKATEHSYRAVMQAFRKSVDLPEKYERMGTVTAFSEMRYELSRRADEIRDDIQKCRKIQYSIDSFIAKGGA